MNDIDAWIERIKNTTTTLVTLLAEMEEQREREMMEIGKRVSRLEFELARLNNK